MNLVAAVIISILLNQRIVRCQKCEKVFFDVAFPSNRFVVFGARSDTAVTILPDDVIRDIPSDRLLTSMLQKNVTEKYGFPSAMLMEVHGLLQFLVTWQSMIKDGGALYTTTYLTYFKTFRLVFTPSSTQIICKTSLSTLLHLTDSSTNEFIFETTRDSRLFLYRHHSAGQYEIIFGRAGTKLFIKKMVLFELRGFTGSPPITTVKKKTWRWMARRQNSPAPQVDCVVEVSENFGVGILYSRTHLVNAYFDMGNSAFDCDDDSCRQQIRSDGGKTYHDNEVAAVHQKDSFYLGFRNGYIFSYRVINAKEKFSEILFSLDLAHQRYQGGEIKDTEELHLISVDGKESIAVICGPATYYRIYNTNPGDGIKTIHLNRAEMTSVPEVNKKCRKVDYDAKQALLIIYVDSSTAFQVKLTRNHDGAVKNYPDPKLKRFDNFRGTTDPYDSIETLWPLQLRNGRTLFYNESTKAIDMSYSVFNPDGSTSVKTEVLTKYGSYVNALSYFPIEYIENAYINIFRAKTTKYRTSYYGIRGCTVFVTMNDEDVYTLVTTDAGCDTQYTMRALLLDSHITVVRTKDGISVEGVRIKVSISHEDVELALKQNGTVKYIHNLVDAEFESNNSFTIAPNTFNTIHNVGEYTYYQATKRDECTYHFKRRKITKAVNKDIEDYPFPALAVSHRQFMKAPCDDFEMESAMYDEMVRGVVYTMRRKGESAVLVTPNEHFSDALKLIQPESFMNRTIHSTALPYVLYDDPKGPSVLSINNPQHVPITFNGTFAAIGFYSGKFLYRAADVSYILGAEIEAVEELLNDTKMVTKAMAKQDLEKAAFGEESEIIIRPEIYTKRCKLIKAPYFMAFILKVGVLDLLLTLILIILIIYHRARIIPARRRFKIKMGILKHRKKRKLRDRARRRLRKLNILRRRKKKTQQEGEAKRQAALIAAAVGALGMAQGQPAPAAAPAGEKKSSSSSSEMVTAGGENAPGGEAPAKDAPGAQAGDSSPAPDANAAAPGAT